MLCVRAEWLITSQKLAPLQVSLLGVAFHLSIHASSPIPLLFIIIPSPPTPTIQHSSNPTIQQSNNPALQHSSNPTIQQSSNPSLPASFPLVGKTQENVGFLKVSGGILQENVAGVDAKATPVLLSWCVTHKSGTIAEENRPEVEKILSIEELKTLPAPQGVNLMIGPCGAGKSTLTKRLLEAHPDKFIYLHQYTTRPRRQMNELRRLHQFVTLEEFDRLKARGQIIAPHQRFGYRYGIGLSDLAAAMASGKIILMGSERLADFIEAAWTGSKVRRTAVLPMPPPQLPLQAAQKEKLKQIIVQRLRRRDPFVEKADLENRLRANLGEFAHVVQMADEVIVNDGPLEPAFREFEAAILRAFGLKSIRTQSPYHVAE